MLEHARTLYSSLAHRFFPKSIYMHIPSLYTASKKLWSLLWNISLFLMLTVQTLACWTMITSLQNFLLHNIKEVDTINSNIYYNCLILTQWQRLFRGKKLLPEYTLLPIMQNNYSPCKHFSGIQKFSLVRAKEKLNEAAFPGYESWDL